MSKSAKPPLFFLYHIKESIDAIYSYLQGDSQRFLHERMAQKAILYELVTIGEAANKLSDDFKIAHPDVPWRDIVDFRNVLAHHYWAVSPTVVCQILENEDKLPFLKQQVELFILEIEISSKIDQDY
jgi:uncharacterized protein with HEPN domain